MAEADRKLANGAARIDFATDPSRYRHWKLKVDGDVATLLMDVDEKGGLFEGYELKLNSYDLGVDIELADALTRLRFEHPQVRVILLRSGKPRVFCAGANIRMLAGASHAHKVNFCKFTNETRNGIEDASEFSGQRTICVVTGPCAGGGYELALAADHIILTDDGSSTVALPELPLLAVLPGTGGLTRVTDKRKVRRDHADVFCTTEEGIKGKRAVEWRLVDEVVPNTKLEDVVKERARQLAAKSDRPAGAKGITLAPLERRRRPDGVDYGTMSVEFARAERLATITLRGPDTPPPATIDALLAQGAAFWPLKLARELDDAILDIRANEFDVAAIVFKSEGDSAAVLAYDAFLDAHRDHWLVREIRLLWKRVLKRIDLTSRTLVALIEPGSCFAGTLAELAFAADRSYMLIGRRDGEQSPAGCDCALGGEFRRLSDVQRALAPRQPFSRASRHRSRRRAPRSGSRSTPRPRSSLASSPSRSTTSTGRTRSACSSRSARAFQPTASPAWRRTCASAGRRRWSRRSSRASPPGRTGSSSVPMLLVRKARCAATAPARRPCSIPGGYDPWTS